ncbi:MAG TPA: GAF domain-containing protein [Petrotogaceae bacterium]|nr:GAF domain-containing protein [Petrotogaceae bacterium]
MRSVFSDFTEDFFQIISFRKETWEDFWYEYKKQKPKVISEYLRLNGISDADAVSRLLKLGRRYIDMAFWFRQERFSEVKYRIVKMLTDNPQRYQLDRGDYSVHVICMFGEKPYEMIDTYAGTIIAVDFLYFYNHQKELTFETIVDQAILDFLSKVPFDKKKADFCILLEEIKKIVNDTPDRAQAMSKIVSAMSKRINYYNWVGFYLTDTDQKDTLVLGPYVGEPTEHVKIPFGSGICGQAAQNKTTFVVGDVSKETNYLSCSSKTLSEIVVPIKKSDSSVVGEIDIDSHFIEPFDNKDTLFLEEVAYLISKKYYK